MNLEAHKAIIPIYQTTIESQAGHDPEWPDNKGGNEHYHRQDHGERLWPYQ